MKLVGIDLGASAARVALPENEGCRVVSLSVPGVGGPVRPDADTLFGAELPLLETTGPVSGAVLAVGAATHPGERAALRAAASRHGFARLRLVAAPVAAALASLRRGELKGRVLVVDLGDSGLSVAVLHVAPPQVDVVCMAHTDAVGGRRLDDIAAALLAELSGPDPSPEIRRQAAAAARGARHELTDHFEVRVMLDVPGGTRRAVKLSRDQFEQRVRPLLMRAEPTLRGALSEAMLRPEDLDLVLLVGGCASMPLVRRFMTEVTGRRVRVPEVPETWAAEGAALYAQALWEPGAEPIRLTPALSHGVRVAGLQDAAELVLPRSCALPARAACVRPADLELCLEGEPADLSPEASAGAQPVYLRARLAEGGDAPVTWTIDADADGVLSAFVADHRAAEAAPAPRRTPGADARRLPALRAELSATRARVEALAARGVPAPSPWVDAAATALEAADAAGAEAALTALTDWLAGVART